MARNTLTTKQAQKIAQLFLQRRSDLGLSTRQVATRAGISPGTVHLLEHGINLSPRPDILKALAGALEIPLSELYLIADWLTPQELPSLQPYLRAKYGLGKREAAEVSDYLNSLQQRADGGSGPTPGEDEY